jgi:transcriptional regulator with XRE-family HTH domain
MHINERFLKIMEHYNFSPSLFADEIGVIRSSVSHIVSGRNNPGVDLLQKVLKRFPDISTDWLMLGIGEMLRQEGGQATSAELARAEAKAMADKNLFAQPKQERRQMTLDDFTAQAPAATQQHEIPQQSVVEEKRPETNVHNGPGISVQLNATQPAKIKRITVFYEDNSFQDFIAQ